ncbi:MAG: class I SAM-dependent methyltransferase [Pseudomonadota bacterium]|nr:class I SAM-dependent methyltransferase [Pseudomonadota bacterium]
MNNPDFFKKSRVDRYIDRINNERMTDAEKKLSEAIGQLPDTMSPMPGAENQKIGYMDAGAEEAHFLTMMVRDLGRQHDRPMKALDIGTFAGHTAGAIAKGMDENGGKVITCDVSDQYKPIAEEYWKNEGVADRVDYQIVPARKLLDDLVGKPEEHNTYDMVFIDADKTGYDDYYEQALKLLRPGGKIVLDNMLWSGRVTDETLHDASTDALRDLNQKIAGDKRRVAAVLLSAADGIMIAEKLGYTRQLRQSAGSPAPERS